MKSSFWHIGVNKTKEMKERRAEYRAPRVNPDGSIECRLLPDHSDPDFGNLTYGEPWGRIERLEDGDVAFFIESGTGDEWRTWSYYVVAIYVTELVYRYRNGQWSPRTLQGEHLDRVSRNAHFSEREEKYAVLLGSRLRSKVIFDKPFRLSDRQDPLKAVKLALRLDPNSPLSGYWWKHWFGDEETERLLELIEESYK